MKFPLPALIFSASLAVGTVCAAEKDDYSIFYPTPRAAMREMSTDRPDTTESAYTVDAGHFQAELTLFGYGKDGGTEAYAFADSNFKIGLTNDIDLQLVVTLFERERGGGVDDSGIGDLITRVKWNLWGNDGGKTALAVMPFVKAPTASHDLGNDHVEGGVIVPLAITLTDRLGLSTMVEVDVVRDDVGGGYETDFVNTISLAYSWTDDIGSFVEFISVAGTREDAPWEGYAKSGITFAVTDDFMMDAGVIFGVNDSAQDFGAFIGMSWRH